MQIVGSKCTNREVYQVLSMDVLNAQSRSVPSPMDGSRMTRTNEKCALGSGWV